VKQAVVLQIHARTVSIEKLREHIALLAWHREGALSDEFVDESVFGRRSGTRLLIVLQCASEHTEKRETKVKTMTTCSAAKTSARSRAFT